MFIIATVYAISLLVFLFTYTLGSNYSAAARLTNSFSYVVFFFGLLFTTIFFLLFSLLWGTTLFFVIFDPAVLPFFLVFILVTPITLLYVYKYRSDELASFYVFTFIIIIIGFGLFAVDSIVVFFFLYEALLLPSFFILYMFAKTRKAVEAAFLMFFWTQFGALFLIFAVQYIFIINTCYFFSELPEISLSRLESSLVFLCLLVGFGVKFPIWPFYDWLPQAHVEASTNFSIFLSGVLVKFAFFGFIKFMTLLGFDSVPFWFYPFILVGFLDSSTKLYYQTDLKKVVAYSTVIEMHWLTIAVVGGTNLFWLGASAMLISHALLSSNFFFFVDSITRRYKTRLVSEVSGVCYQNPNLYFAALVTLVLFLGFPGTLFFLAEVLFFTALLDFNFLYFFIFFFFAYFVVPSCFFKSWFVVLFGSSKSTPELSTSDLAKYELLVVWFFILLLVWFGLSSSSLIV